MRGKTFERRADRLNFIAKGDGSYEREFGWRRGMRHSVLLLGAAPYHGVEIVDPNPAIGGEVWPLDDLEFLYRGPALQLVARR